MTGKYENCHVSVYSVRYCLYDEEGNEILNDDGTTKLFFDANYKIDTTTWAEWIQPDDLEEVMEWRQ